MRVNRGNPDDRPSDQTGGGMKAPSGGSSGGQSSRTSGGMRAPSGGGSPQREGADQLRSRTDRGNQNDEGIGSSADRGGGGGEGNTPRRADASDLDATPDAADRFGSSRGRSENPDVTGTRDITEE